MKHFHLLLISSFLPILLYAPAGYEILPQITGTVDNLANSIALQTNGKMILGGTSTGVGTSFFSLIRLNPGGSLDGSFNTAGFGGVQPGTFIVPTIPGENLSEAHAVTLQADGKVLIAGFTNVIGSGPHYSIARLTTAGMLDTTFNAGGAVPGICTVPSLFFGNSDKAYAMQLQPDGKILLGGLTLTFTPQNRYSIARLLTDGSLDSTTFNPGGSGGSTPGSLVLPTFAGSSYDKAQALQLQPNGKILLAGYSTLGGHTRYSIARITADGSLDTTYVVPQFTNSTDDEVKAMMLQPDGKILLAGYSIDNALADKHYSIARLNDDATTLDPTFNPLGALPGTLVLPNFDGTTVNDQVQSIQLQPDGKILLGGFSDGGGFWYTIARLTTNGSLDPTFNPTGLTPGMYLLPRFTGSNSDQGQAIQLLPNGKIIFTGFSGYGLSSRYSVARLTQDGSLDTTFPSAATAGMLVLNPFTGSTEDQALAATLQIDGKIVLGGFSHVGGNDYISSTRITTNGSLDTSFNSNGIGGTDPGTFILAATTGIARSVQLQANGTLIFGGTTNQTGTGRYIIASLTSDGSLATSFNQNGSGFLIIPHFSLSTDDEAYAMALQSNGNAILAGTSYHGTQYSSALIQITPPTLASYQDEFPNQGGFY